MEKSFLKPSPGVLDSLTDAVEEYRQAQAAARAEQIEQERQSKIAEQIERVGKIVTAACATLEPTNEHQYAMRTTEWRPLQINFSDQRIALEGQLSAFYTQARRHFWNPVQANLQNVKLYTRPYNTSLQIHARAIDYPVLFDHTRNQILYSPGNDGIGVPGMHEGDITVLPGTEEWQRIDQVLQLFESSEA